MQRSDLLKSIAETGYNVGIGAKKHFATHDIVDKIPGLISVISLAIGICSLVWEVLAGKALAATLAVFGVLGLYIQFYEAQKDAYLKVGTELTQLLNRLRDLYRSAKTCAEVELPNHEQQLKSIENEFYARAIGKQIQFSDWYAHYKFFWQHQIDWIDEQKRFRLLRDKIPLSLYLTVIIGIMAIAIYYVMSS